ncbi:hypothetical protein GCM10028801_07300 [Nocardioides maradonensis]
MSGIDPYVVKRYANRKLYDTVLRRFTTLDDIAKLLEQGTQVVVRDHSTGADRTDEILGQVLGRRVSRTPGGTDLLAGLLRAPAQIAVEVAGTLGDPTRLTGSGSRDKVKVELEDDVTATKPKPKKKSGAKTKATSKSGGKPKAKKAKADAEDPEELMRRQQAEIRELRGQVSELTAAVTLLLKEKSAELEAEAASQDVDDD